MQKKIKLFSNCIPVKGANRSVICDLQRTQLSAIPNDLFTILKKYEGLTINEIKSIYNNKFDSIIDEYFRYLIELEYLFLTDTPEFFPPLNTYWESPFSITNAIIDVDESSDYQLTDVFNQLDKLNCKHIQIRFFEINPKVLLEALKYSQDKNSIIHSIDILVHHKYFPLKFWQNKLIEFPRLKTILIYGCTKKEFNDIQKINNKKIFSTQKLINSKTHCGVISVKDFAVNIPNFTESLKYNSCLNKKISIDVNGDIKNCPSLSQNFGKLNNSTLQESLNQKDFKKYWHITKDQIETCKDCEFRYVCTDCRAYVEEPENKLSKPLKCGYNPYTNEWQEWSTNPLKQKAIEYYKMQDLIKENDN